MSEREEFDERLEKRAQDLVVIRDRFDLWYDEHREFGDCKTAVWQAWVAAYAAGVAAERKRCAKVCESRAEFRQTIGMTRRMVAINEEAISCANKIRSGV